MAPPSARAPPSGRRRRFAADATPSPRPGARAALASADYLGAVHLADDASPTAPDDDDDLESLSSRASEYARLRADNVLLSHVVTEYVADEIGGRRDFSPRPRE